MIAIRMQNTGSYIMHYGKKGMKWGHHSGKMTRNEVRSARERLKNIKESNRSDNKEAKAMVRSAKGHADKSYARAEARSIRKNGKINERYNSIKALKKERKSLAKSTNMIEKNDAKMEKKIADFNSKKMTVHRNHKRALAITKGQAVQAKADAIRAKGARYHNRVDRKRSVNLAVARQLDASRKVSDVRAAVTEMAISRSARAENLRKRASDTVVRNNNRMEKRIKKYNKKRSKASDRVTSGTEHNMSYENSLMHYGKKGMKWKGHTYAQPEQYSGSSKNGNARQVSSGSPKGTNTVRSQGRVQQTQNRVTSKESEQKINSKGHYTGKTTHKALKKNYNKMSSKEINTAIADMRNRANLARAQADMSRANFDAKAARIRNFASGVRTAADIASGAATIKKSYNTLMGKEDSKPWKKKKAPKAKGFSKPKEGSKTGFSGQARENVKNAVNKGAGYAKTATRTASAVKSTASDEMNAARARAQAALAKAKKRKK